MFALRQGDDLQRVIALVFSGSREPSSVVKFSRLPGGPGRGHHEAAVLAELRRLAPHLSDHATTVLLRSELDGSEVTQHEIGGGLPARRAADSDAHAHEVTGAKRRLPHRQPFDARLMRRAD